MMRRGASVANAAAVGSMVAMIAFALAVVAWMPAQTPGASVRVFGLVSTAGIGTHPVVMSFADSLGGQVSTAQVVDGAYSVQLPNHRAYNVSMTWRGNYTWQSGRSDLGQLNIDMGEGSMMAQSYNVVQPTPDSEVMVTGSVFWQMVTAQPSTVKFTATDGETFLADVTGLSFNARLPNTMTYEVQVQGTDAAGHSEWLYFHQIDIYAGINVVGLTVMLGY